jgi:hypothetical protein
MKSVLKVASIVLVLWTLAIPAFGAERAINTGTANMAVNSTGSTAGEDVWVQVWSSAGSTATVTIQSKTASDAPWGDAVAITNPPATGVNMYWFPRLKYMRVVISGYSAGTVKVHVQGWRGTWVVE